MSYLDWIGAYLAEKRPDVIVNAGDFADIPSLCSYDVGKRQFEGRRYKNDIESVKEGMGRLLGPVRELQERQRRGKEKVYRPRLVMTLGNHEARITKAVDNDAKLEGIIGLGDLGYEEAGWEVYPFLQVVVVEGIAFSHYFISGIMGRPVTSAQQLLNKHHQSAIMGHVQQRQIAYATRADGQQMTAIFAGCCAPHEEEYLGPQGNQFWKGVWMLLDVNDGEFDELPISLKFLKERYG